MRMTVSEAILRCVKAEGVAHAFGIASGKLGPLFKALSEQSDIRFIGVRHEAAAAHMAAGVFAGTGKMAVALGEMGPGGGNLTTGIAAAHADNLPMLAITSCNVLHLSNPGKGMLMELDLVRMFEPITKLSQCLYDPKRLPELLHLAFRTALSGRPGPVHISIPFDMFGQVVDYDDAHFGPPQTYRSVARLAPQPADVAQAAALLRSAKRPLLIAGGGAVVSEAAPQFIALAEALDAPATATQMGIGMVPTAHPHFIGHGGIIGGTAINRAMAEADVILAVGCRFSSWMWHGNAPGFAPDAQLIHIDTDPSQTGRVTPATLGIVADAREGLQGILNALGPAMTRPSGNAWLDGLRADRARYRADLDKGQPVWGAEGMHPAKLNETLSALLPQDALVVYDGAHTSFWANDVFPVSAPRTRFHEPGMGQLGFGLPYALALQVTHPEQLVVNVCGDGSFGFTAMELDTARRYRLPVLNVLHNNAAWGVIRAGQSHSGFEFMTDLEGTDYAALARGLGCHGENVKTLDEVAPALAQAAASGLPAVLDCRTSFVSHPSMHHFAAMGRG